MLKNIIEEKIRKILKVNDTDARREEFLLKSVLEICDSKIFGNTKNVEIYLWIEGLEGVQDVGFFSDEVMDANSIQFVLRLVKNYRGLDNYFCLEDPCREKKYVGGGWKKVKKFIRKAEKLE